MPVADINTKEALIQFSDDGTSSNSTGNDLSTRRPSEVLLYAAMQQEQLELQQKSRCETANSCSLNSKKSSRNSVYDEPDNNQTVAVDVDISSSNDINNGGGISMDMNNYANANFCFSLSTDPSTSTTPSALNTPDNNSTVPFLKNSLSAILDLTDQQAQAIMHPLNTNTALQPITPMLEDTKEDDWNIDHHTTEPILQPLEKLKIEHANLQSPTRCAYTEKQNVSALQEQEQQKPQSMVSHQNQQLHTYHPASYDSTSSSLLHQSTTFSRADHPDSTYIIIAPHAQHDKTRIDSENQQLGDVLNSSHSNSSASHLLNTSTGSYPFTQNALPSHTHSGTTTPTSSTFGPLLPMNSDYLHSTLTSMLSSNAIEATSVPNVSKSTKAITASRITSSIPPTAINTPALNHIASAPSIPSSSLTPPTSSHSTPNYFTQRHSLPSSSSCNDRSSSSSSTHLPIRPSVSYGTLPFALNQNNYSNDSMHNNLNHVTHNDSGPMNSTMLNQNQFNGKRAILRQRRTSASDVHTTHRPQRTYGRRTSSHPS
ncbi:hypothetical protein BDF20DRAFT_141850 [Mycotypha africana]|uniref:uncharacterized protein n=1 Tax=Mycotypha africana TaxID=64632 RepID=UPI00230004C8|nr:uncharacterized protein BDF20DRAFT_141850 [Mycotypha africana]KAI8969045.1 hypothetical protein BDF20DRAFT_141850 [Mycotypha africana]